MLTERSPSHIVMGENTLQRTIHGIIPFLKKRYICEGANIFFKVWKNTVNCVSSSYFQRGYVEDRRDMLGNCFLLSYLSFFYNKLILFITS